MKTTLLTLVLTAATVIADAQQFLDGPHSPELNYTFQNGTLTLFISNPPASNNHSECYMELIPDFTSAVPDSHYRFQGYLVYQLADCYLPACPYNPNTGTPDLLDPSIARLVAQSDLADSIGTLKSIEENYVTGNCDTFNFVPSAGNSGTAYSYNLTTDAYTGQPFTPGNTYSFVVKSYAVNLYHSFSSCGGTAPVIVSRFTPYGMYEIICFDPATASVSSPDEKTSFSVYPNPVADHFTVNTSENAKHQLQLTDAKGSLVFSQEFTGKQKTIRCENLAEGIYFARLFTENTFAGATKIIKQ